MRLIPNHSADSRADTRGVNVRVVFYCAVGFVVGLGLLLLAVWRMQSSLLRRYGDETGSPRTVIHSQPLQPSPEHPTLPWEDMVAMRRSQEQKLHTYGPQSADRAHIPIDRAIDLLLQSGELSNPWKNPASQPYQTTPSFRAQPSVENRS